MNFRTKLLIAFVIINFGFLLIPTFGDSGIHCPDGMAYRVTEHPAVEGHYVRCEDFDAFFKHLAKGRIEEATRLLIR